MLHLEVVASKGRSKWEECGHGYRVRAIGFVCTDAELPRHWSISDVEGTLVIDEEYCKGFETSKGASA